MRYFEFNEHEYYALLAVDESGLLTDAESAAYEAYFKLVAGDSLDEVKAEGRPRELTEDEAWQVFKNVTNEQRQSFFDFVQEDGSDVKVVLIDGDLT